MEEVLKIKMGSIRVDYSIVEFIFQLLLGRNVFWPKSGISDRLGRVLDLFVL